MPDPFQRAFGQTLVSLSSPLVGGCVDRCPFPRGQPWNESRGALARASEGAAQKNGARVRKLACAWCASERDPQAAPRASSSARRETISGDSRRRPGRARRAAAAAGPPGRRHYEDEFPSVRQRCSESVAGEAGAVASPVERDERRLKTDRSQLQIQLRPATRDALAVSDLPSLAESASFVLATFLYIALEGERDRALAFWRWDGSRGLRRRCAYPF